MKCPTCRIEMQKMAADKWICINPRCPDKKKKEEKK